MLDHSSLSSPALSPEHITSTVLGNFQIDRDQFLIISLEQCSTATSATDEIAEYEELERFKIQGQLCAIVKVEGSSSTEIDIASLLTERELQITTLVASGRSNKQIANQLQISEWTVSTHLRRIFIKLGVDSRAAMVYCCASLIQKTSRA